jgi:putative hydrolase of HD superfamily
MKSDANQALLQLICEAGMLKRVRRSGWAVLGIRDEETVADHSFRTAVIGYGLARMEEVHPYKVLLMTLLNDIHEARIGDLHKMSQRYINIDNAEDEAYADQIAALPTPMHTELDDLRGEYREQTSPESVIARDADILECLIQAREYYEHGRKEALKFTREAPQFLKTESAKALWKLAEATPLNEWWERLSDFKR